VIQNTELLKITYKFVDNSYNLAFIMSSFITCIFYHIIIIIVVVVVVVVVRVIKSRRMRWAGYVGSTREMKNTYKILVGKHEGMRPLGRTRRRWEDNIRIVPKAMGSEVVDWIQLTQYRIL
jgi:hypothetical protein